MEENKTLDLNQKQTDLLKKYKNKRAKSKVNEYEKVNWMNFLIILKINLRNSFKSIPLIVTGSLFVIASLVMTISMHFVNSDNGLIDYSKFSILIATQYICGVILLSVFITILCVFLIRVHKNTGIQNIELRAGMSPAISFFIRLIVILVMVLTYASFNLVLNLIASIGIRFEQDNGPSIILSALLFWYIFGLLFASISLLTAQVISFFAQTALLVILSITFAVSPILANLTRSVPVMKNIFEQKQKAYLMYPKLVAGQEFYNILSSENVDPKLSSLLSDANLFQTLKENIGEVFFSDDSVKISFEDFSRNDNPSIIVDATTLLEFLVQTGNYNVKLTSKPFGGKTDKMSNFLFEGTSIYSLLNDISQNLIGFEDSQENPFISKEENLNDDRTVNFNLKPALDYLSNKYISNPSMLALINLIEVQKQQLDIYDSITHTDIYTIYEEPQFVRTGGEVMPMFKYQENSQYFDFEYDNGHQLIPSMQMISYIILQLYKNMYISSNYVDTQFDINMFIEQEGNNYIFDSSVTSVNVMNMLNIFNHTVFIYLNGKTSPMTWNYLNEKFSLISKFSLTDFQVNVNLEAWSSIYQNGEKPNKTTSESILFAKNDKGSSKNTVTIKDNIEVAGIIVWYLFLTIGLFSLSYLQYLKRARY
ncbi:hypothetical protein [Spiroplasma monobiae]|uniref:Uncharacterized protein n=1 Tax=Spiroplasma monobiae MQ-1 TaxID=1336748 RepID=A0A2K9LU76_SPISQ|nr:hypothetical protein [Spiroplasma monobiae]AUM62602.1 hypothetical protein SMONO_v1c03530 [Spiroplasma monobiae MQ-1]